MSQRTLDRGAILTNEELIRAWQRGDAGALETLVQRYHAPVLAHLYRVLADSHLAENLVQETFLRLIRDAQSYRYPRPWFTSLPALRPCLLSAAGNTTLPPWLGLVCAARAHLWRDFYARLYDADTRPADHCLSCLSPHLGAAAVSHPIHSPTARYYRGCLFSWVFSRAGGTCLRHHSHQAVPPATSGLAPG